MNDKTCKPEEYIPYGDLLLSTLHKQYVRFVRWVDSRTAVVMDRNTLKELPDYAHHTQLQRCR